METHKIATGTGHSAPRWFLGLCGLALMLTLVVGVGGAQVPSVTLTWTASGDDSLSGMASQQEIRWSNAKPDTTTIQKLNTWWSGAAVVPNVPAPLAPGTAQSVTFSPQGGFAVGQTYYFILRTADEVPNWSGYSNVAWRAVTDTIPPASCRSLRAQ